MLLLLLVKRFDKTLRIEVLVPKRGKALMLAVKLRVNRVPSIADEPRPLLYAHVIVAVVESGQMRASDHANLEAHLRVAHEVAALFAVVRDGKSGQPHRAGFRGGFDHKGHVRRVFNPQIKVAAKPSGHFENADDGSSCRHLAFYGCAVHEGRLQRGKNDGGGLLHHFQALGQQGSVAVVEVDVIG